MAKKCPKSANGHHKPVKEIKYNGTKWYRSSSRPEVVESRIRCNACDTILDNGAAKNTRKHEIAQERYQF